MNTRLARFHGMYGAGPLHLLGVLASLALAGYVVSVLGVSALWDPDVWWQSILVWFLGAVVVHDLVLFPVYALADRTIGGFLCRRDGRRPHPRVVPLNYVRVPVLAVGLLFLLFFPGVVEQGASTYLDATGQTQEPFLRRWLLLSAAIFILSATVYAIRLWLAKRNSLGPAGRPERPGVR